MKPSARFVRLIGLRVLARLARPFARPAAGAPARILYIKPDHLGDLLLATPALAALRRRFPSAQITGVVGPWSRQIIERDPAVSVILTCPFPGFERDPKTEGQASHTHQRKSADGFTTKAPRLQGLATWRLGGLALFRASGARWLWSFVLRPSSFVLRLSSLARPYLTLLRYALLLRAGRYDLAIIGRDDHWWGAALALLAGIPRRVGFAVPECRPFLTDALPWDPRQHVTAQGLALVAACGLPPAAPDAHDGARFDPSPAERAWARAWIRAQGVGAGEPLVVIHPGTGGPAKLWRSARWSAVADALQAQGARVLLTGGPGEAALVAEVAGGMRAPPLTLAGQTTIGQLAALFRAAALAMGVDSGPLHLAAAQGIPTIHLYGPGDAGRFGPWGDPARHVVVRADLWCSPCGVFDACPRGLAQPECMELIAAGHALAHARRLLGSA